MKTTLGIVCFLVFYFGTIVGVSYLAYSLRPVATRAPEYVGDQPPGTTVLLVAILPDGTRVYRIENPTSMIVPAVVAVSPSGQVAFR